MSSAGGHDRRSPELTSTTTSGASAPSLEGSATWPEARSPADVEREQAESRIRGALFGGPAVPLRIGRFALGRKLGEGGMGLVFAAYDSDLHREVAIKLLRPRSSGDVTAASARLLREAQGLARVAHPNVIAVHETGLHDGTVFLVMELVHGVTLGAHVREAMRPWLEVTELLLGAGEGLAAAHALGLVHRDVKPDNILVGRDGRPRLADFGLVRSAHADEPASAAAFAGAGAAHATSPGALVGTPRYMALEQLRGEEATAESDQFAFCATAFEMLYGQSAFSGTRPDERAWAIAAGRLATVGPRHPARALLPALARGLAADPARRHPSMRALLDAMREGLREQRARGRLPAMAAGGALFVLAAVAAALVGLRVARPSDTEAWDRAVVLSQNGRFDDCVAAARGAPRTERLVSLWVGCADALGDVPEVRRACDAWSASFTTPPSQQCDPILWRARELLNAGRYEDCIALIERSPPTTYLLVEVTRCAAPPRRLDLYRRTCEYRKKHFHGPDCL